MRASVRAFLTPTAGTSPGESEIRVAICSLENNYKRLSTTRWLNTPKAIAALHRVSSLVVATTTWLCLVVPSRSLILSKEIITMCRPRAYILLPRRQRLSPGPIVTAIADRSDSCTLAFCSASATTCSMLHRDERKP